MRTHLLYKKHKGFIARGADHFLQRYCVSLVTDILDLSKPIVFKDYRECIIKGYIGEFIAVEKAIRKYV